MAPFTVTLAEACTAANSLLAIGGVTPNQSILGRTSPMLPVVDALADEGASSTDLRAAWTSLRAQRLAYNKEGLFSTPQRGKLVDAELETISDKDAHHEISSLAPMALSPFFLRSKKRPRSESQSSSRSRSTDN